MADLFHHWQPIYLGIRKFKESVKPTINKKRNPINHLQVYEMIDGIFVHLTI